MHVLSLTCLMKVISNTNQTSTDVACLLSNSFQCLFKPLTKMVQLASWADKKVTSKSTQKQLKSK